LKDFLVVARAEMAGSISISKIATPPEKLSPFPELKYPSSICKKGSAEAGNTASRAPLLNPFVGVWL